MVRHPLAARSSSVPGETNTSRDGDSLSLVVASCRTAADEYDEGLQRTPELEMAMVTTVV